MKNLFLLLAVALGVFCLTPASWAAHDAAHQPEVINVSASVDGCKLDLVTPNKTGMVQVLLKATRDGAPAQNLALTGSVEMPQMPMKGFPHEIVFTETDAPGIYGALVQYPHGGLWRITVKGDIEGKPLMHQFDFTLAH